MNKELITKVLNDKILKNENIIKLRVDEYNFSIQDTCDLLAYAKKELKEKGYTIYSSGQKYIYNKKEFIVNDGEIIVAIK